MDNFPNGFKNWQETHYEVVSMLTIAYEKGNLKVEDYMKANGTGGMYELAEYMTNKFELENKDREWDGEFFEEIEYFFNDEIDKL